MTRAVGDQSLFPLSCLRLELAHLRHFRLSGKVQGVEGLAGHSPFDTLEHRLGASIVQDTGVPISNRTDDMRVNFCLRS